jgi:hypothetical protein
MDLLVIRASLHDLAALSSVRPTMEVTRWSRGMLSRPCLRHRAVNDSIMRRREVIPGFIPLGRVSKVGLSREMLWAWDEGT